MAMLLQRVEEVGRGDFPAAADGAEASIERRPLSKDGGQRDTERHRRIPRAGAFVVFEAVIDDERRQNAFGLLMSLNMLIETPGGFDFSGADCRRWFEEAGFRQSRVEHLAGPDSMVIGIK
jgi:hypothetical protein